MNLKLDEIRIPKKIDPCPLEDAIVEVRFESTFPLNAIFGIIYNEFKDTFPQKPEELPILQIPQEIREKDKNLHYKPYYKLKKDDRFSFQVGPRVFSLISHKPYAGWDLFSKKLQDIVKKIKKLDILSSYLRVGLRYINSFDFNIFEQTNLSLNINEENLTNNKSYLLTEIATGKFKSTLQISNFADIKGKKRSIIDIDAFLENPDGKIWKLLEIGHKEEKRLFFSLLKKTFVKNELNPEY